MRLSTSRIALERTPVREEGAGMLDAVLDEPHSIVAKQRRHRRADDALGAVVGFGDVHPQPYRTTRARA